MHLDLYTLLCYVNPQINLCLNHMFGKKQTFTQGQNTHQMVFPDNGKNGSILAHFVQYATSTLMLYNKCQGLYLCYKATYWCLHLTILEIYEKWHLLYCLISCPTSVHINYWFSFRSHLQFPQNSSLIFPIITIYWLMISTFIHTPNNVYVSATVLDKIRTLLCSCIISSPVSQRCNVYVIFFPSLY